MKESSPFRRSCFFSPCWIAGGRAGRNPGPKCPVRALILMHPIRLVPPPGSYGLTFLLRNQREDRGKEQRIAPVLPPMHPIRLVPTAGSSGPALLLIERRKRERISPVLPLIHPIRPAPSPGSCGLTSPPRNQRKERRKRSSRLPVPLSMIWGRRAKKRGRGRAVRRRERRRVPGMG